MAEVALSIALLVGAGLLVRSFVRLTSVDPGYEPDRLVYLALSLPERTYPDGARRLQFQRRLRDSLAGTPGIGAVSMASGVPPRAGFHFNVAPQVEGEEPKPWGQRVWLPNSDVDPTFFETLRVPIVAGRNFTSADTPESGNVIIDRGFASFLFGDDYPIGRRFRIREQSPWLMVVGLVEDVKLMGRDDRQSPYEIFAPYPHDGAPEYVQLVMRTASAPDAMLPLIRQEVRELDPQLPLAELATGRALLAESVDEPRFFLLLMSTLAAIGLALAALGTYGVLAFTVTRRSRELGVRAALGAGTGRLRMMVLGDGVRLAAVGAAAGLLMSLAFGRVMEVLLFQVEPTDTMTLVTVPIVIIGTAALASWIPARRATRVDPVEVLRSE